MLRNLPEEAFPTMDPDAYWVNYINNLISQKLDAGTFESYRDVFESALSNLSDRINNLDPSGDGINLLKVWKSLTNRVIGPSELDDNIKIAPAHIPIATRTTIGGVRPDGTTITINENGVISANGGGSGGGGETGIIYTT